MENLKLITKIMAIISAVTTIIVIPMYLYICMYNIGENTLIADIFKPLFIFWVTEILIYLVLLMLDIE